MSSAYVAILDYQMSNMFSVERTCEFVGLPAILTCDPKILLNSTGAILPGVGAFGAAMENLRRLDLISPLRDFVASGRPLFGICLGMQLLFSQSEEFGIHQGLGFIEGTVERFPARSASCEKVKVPQIGWNTIRRSGEAAIDWKKTPFEDIADEEYMYFVHSYYCRPKNPAVIAFETTYAGVSYCSAVIQGTVWGTQFHPEKSAHEGIKMYRNLRQLLGL